MRTFWIVIGACLTFAWVVTLALAWFETGHFGIPWETFVVTNVVIALCIAFAVGLAKVVERLEI